MPRPTRAQTKQRTRRTLIESARSCIAAVGLQKASLDRIAEEAGFTKGALYWHFPSKQALFLAVLEDGLDRQIDELQEMLDASGSTAKQFERRFNGWLDNLEKDELPLLGLELQFESRRSPAFAAQFADVIGRHQLALSVVLERLAVLCGRTLRLPPDQLAGTVIAISGGLALTREAASVGPIASFGSVVRILLDMPERRGQD